MRLAHAATVRRVALRAFRIVDVLCDTLALSALTAMVLVVVWQVFGRFVLNNSPRWSSEVALLLLAWVGLLGIAIGIRERSHIAVSLIHDRLPSRLAAALTHLSTLLMLTFGCYLVVDGARFTQLMHRSTLPATGLPNSLLYAAMPVAGVLICVYGVGQIFSLNIPRYGDTPGPEQGEPL